MLWQSKLVWVGGWLVVKAVLRFAHSIQSKKLLLVLLSAIQNWRSKSNHNLLKKPGGWMVVCKVILRIAYSNQKYTAIKNIAFVCESAYIFSIIVKSK